MASCNDEQTMVLAADSNPDISLILVMKSDISAKLPPDQTMQFRRPDMWCDFFLRKRFASKAEIRLKLKCSIRVWISFYDASIIMEKICILRQKFQNSAK